MTGSRGSVAGHPDPATPDRPALHLADCSAPRSAREQQSRPTLPGSPKTPAECEAQTGYEHRPRPPARGTWHRSLATPMNGQGESESCALPNGPARGPDAAAVGLDNGATDGEAQTRTGHCSLLLAALKLGEQSIGISGRKTRPIVVDGDAYPIALGNRRDLDDSPLRGVTQDVVEQIGQ